MCLAFSHDGRFLTSCGDAHDERMFIWDVHAGTIVVWVTLNPNPTEAVLFGGFVRDIKRRDTHIYQMATCGRKGVVLWAVDVVKGEALGVPAQQMAHTVQSRLYISLAFSKDGDWLYAGSSTGDVACISLRTKNLHASVQVCGKGACAMTCLPDGELVVGGGDGTVTLLAGKGIDFEAVKRVTLDGPILTLRPSPDDAEVIVASAEGSVIRLGSQDLNFQVLSHNPGEALNFVRFPAGMSDCFLSGDRGGYMTCWDQDGWVARFKRFLWQKVAPTCADASTEVALTGWTDGRVRCYDMSRGLELWHLDYAQKEGVTSVELSKNQRFFVTSGEDGSVRIFQMKTREMAGHLQGHTARVSRALLSADNQQVVSVGRDRTMMLWDLRTQKRLTSHFVRGGGINGVCLSPSDPNVAVTISQPREMMWWDFRSPKPTRTLVMEKEQLSIAASKSIGTRPYVAVGGSDRIVRLFDMDEGRHLVSGEAHTAGVSSLDFSADDKQIVSAGLDQTLCIWNFFPSGSVGAVTGGAGQGQGVPDPQECDGGEDGGGNIPPPSDEVGEGTQEGGLMNTADLLQGSTLN
eukprot:Cvel_45.t2-p1 / transcript=Cvel_45.t2 / gene=Cvel_45 / organism=Chromera_velia_CCMP2878 / gene_product=WD repeat-containing protein 16, putative / transcript_product=WD repeat-containing protein 16, putative / location=Cvel_scaffold5:264954-267049(+) / protein_length=575 / sequence_SO=supercontig / SO=protein_coding / is_pseudo=false